MRCQRQPWPLDTELPRDGDPTVEGNLRKRYSPVPTIQRASACGSVSGSKEKLPTWRGTSWNETPILLRLYVRNSLRLIVKLYVGNF